jgi:hypothetical protein
MSLLRLMPHHVRKLPKSHMTHLMVDANTPCNSSHRTRAIAKDKVIMLNDLVGVMRMDTSNRMQNCTQSAALAAIVFCVNHELIELHACQPADDDDTNETNITDDDASTVHRFLKSNKFDDVGVSFLIAELRVLRARNTSAANNV